MRGRLDEKIFWKLNFGRNHLERDCYEAALASIESAVSFCKGLVYEWPVFIKFEAARLGHGLMNAASAHYISCQPKGDLLFVCFALQSLIILNYRLARHAHPLMQISGASRATLRAKPAASVASTTAPMSL